MVRLGLFITFILVFGITTSADAQECGPSCPVCSGSGDNTGALLTQGTFFVSGLYIPEGEDETGVLSVTGKFGERFAKITSRSRNTNRCTQEESCVIR